MTTDTSIAALIDHTLLRPDATPDQIAALCDQARAHGFKSVCVTAIHVPYCAAALRGTQVLTCTVVGFPLGASPTCVKVLETEWAIAHGAREIDMVLSVGDLIAGNHDTVRDDIAAVKKACGDHCLKVIFETCLLTPAQIETACRLSVEAGADFVKTSTGFSSGGATIDAVALMARTVGPDIGVKASGGIATRSDALAMIAAGATRIGASKSIAITTI
ncbi:deoxyribose-phosphate aldolase [Thioclava sp. SK-1]|uniref:deoxyribose-phosphate aldolase n=1 Tax=Thioclava sp. SK-1 TaxID=1889770 RepID=UPI0008252C68|nr:deoxyribose-phosphate aldolase [Thioclava sp. SK-1]OCX66230.1 deoxyribose-phosphate aldolase [Thioclava sp. SK-1]